MERLGRDCREEKGRVESGQEKKSTGVELGQKEGNERGELGQVTKQGNQSRSQSPQAPRSAV